ncbi:MAG: peptide chain release factor N(5)-glutamine methyltransferase [Oscillospiraceae bacterium]|nr:peptide chain release factor N(5)-glutamine methyltransferase [Oscillospiraceae bacterium]
MADTIFEAYNKTKKELQKIGIEDFMFEAKQIIKHITGYSNAEILSRYNTRLTEFQQNNLTAILKQRAIRYPLQYILCSWGFYGREYSVGPGVLIPRADTETLIDTAKELIKDKKSPKIIDLCTGSGCIGITLALERKDAEVDLLEKYPEAMRYAYKNIVDNGAENVLLFEGDVLKGDKSEEKYDLIVSNPPYISDSKMEIISPEVHFEPETALRGGADGLDFYRAIIENYTKSLNDGGSIAFEVGIGQAESVAALLRDAGFVKVSTAKDLNGTDRVVFGTLS